MGYPVVHFEVVGKDIKTLQSFYKQAFDWKIEPMAPGAGVPEYAMINPEAEGSINGGIGAGMEGYDGHVTFYVGVPQLEPVLSKIESLRGRTIMGPDDVPNGPRIALFSDPEGHVVGLVQIDSSSQS